MKYTSITGVKKSCFGGNLKQELNQFNNAIHVQMKPTHLLIPLFDDFAEHFYSSRLVVEETIDTI